MLTTPFTRVVGCSVPIQLAGVPGVTAPELVVAVADAGGLAMRGATNIPAPLLAEILEDLGRRTQGVFGANFLMPFLDRTCVGENGRDSTGRGGHVRPIHGMVGSAEVHP